MKKIYDNSINQELFSIDFQSDFSEDEVYRLSIIAQKLIEEYGDQIIFDEWYKYLKESVFDKYHALNFMLSFFNFNGHNLKVKDPYPFLVLLFSKLGLSLNDENFNGEDETIFETFDSIYVSLLIKSGIISSDEYSYVNLFTDEKFKMLVEN